MRSGVVGSGDGNGSGGCGNGFITGQGDHGGAGAGISCHGCDGKSVWWNLPLSISFSCFTSVSSFCDVFDFSGEYLCARRCGWQPIMSKDAPRPCLFEPLISTHVTATTRTKALGWGSAAVGVFYCVSSGSVVCRGQKMVERRYLHSCTPSTNMSSPCRGISFLQVPCDDASISVCARAFLSSAHANTCHVLVCVRMETKVPQERRRGPHS